MKKIAFLTASNFDEDIAGSEGKLRDEFELLKPIFLNHGVQLERAVWDSVTDWKQYSTLLVKNVWDYPYQQEKFRNFCAQVRQNKIPIINPVEVVLWNMDKSYLLDVLKAGLPVVPLEVIKNESEITEKLFNRLPSRLILKPSCSSGSFLTALIDNRDWKNHLELMRKILAHANLVIQPFVEEIAEGEYSFFYFGGEFSHAVKKTPAKNDFRALHFYGAKNETYSPTADEISEVKHFLSAAPAPVCYARIDLVKIGKSFSLIELELIEPYLYLEYASNPESSAKNFVEAVASKVTNTDGSHP